MDMSLLLLSRGKLHGKVEEAFFIAFGVALDEPDHLLCRRHKKLLSEALNHHQGQITVYCATSYMVNPQ